MVRIAIKPFLLLFFVFHSELLVAQKTLQLDHSTIGLEDVTGRYLLNWHDDQEYLIGEVLVIEKNGKFEYSVFCFDKIKFTPYASMILFKGKYNFQDNILTFKPKKFSKNFSTEFLNFRLQLRVFQLRQVVKTSKSVEELELIVLLPPEKNINLENLSLNTYVENKDALERFKTQESTVIHRHVQIPFWTTKLFTRIKK